jgi:DNA-binding NtrC family response regulator
MAKRSILYLDDEAMCLDVFQQVFSEEYDIRTALTLDEARRALSERPPDIIISDQTMPGLQGSDFLREAATACPLSIRVMLTGSVYAGEVLREISTGVINLFISKPWAETDMRRALERAMMPVTLRKLF